MTMNLTIFVFRKRKNIYFMLNVWQNNCYSSPKHYNFVILTYVVLNMFVFVNKILLCNSELLNCVQCKTMLY